MKIIEYQIVGRDSSTALSDEVNGMISEGWQPFGDLSVQQLVVEEGFTGEGYQYYFNQAMVRYEGSANAVGASEINDRKSEDVASTS